MSLRHSCNTSLAFLVVVIAAASPAMAEPPLRERIDAAIRSGHKDFDTIAAHDADDAAFARRVYLDLAGVIPSVDQARQFLANESPNKRVELVDRILESPQHARRMQYVFDTMLMERRGDKHIKSKAWRDYLRQSFSQNKPWDQLASEILTADGAEKETRAAAKFLLDREMKIDEMTRDLGRIFLGRDLQCAQCHDHPTVDDYLQLHYHGLSAFLSRSYLFNDPKSKESSIGEKADGTVSFTSVFTDESGETAPRLLELPPIEDPPVAKEPYKVKPEKKARSIPVYSRRLQLATAMTDSSNTAFRMNIVNRLWAMLMGRGIVEPLDMWHAGNPPSHPALLELLAEAMLEHDYDMRFLLREIALSKSYQRGSGYRAGGEDVATDRFHVAILKPLSPEQLSWSMMEATGLSAQTLDSLKAKHLKADAKNGAKQVDDPLWQEESLHDALRSNVDMFVELFGVVGVQTSQFNASADQALFVRNAAVLQTWLQPSGNRLTARLKTLETQQLIDEFYFSVFSRPPTAQELEQLSRFLEDNSDNLESAIGQLVWAGLSSAEFRLNH
jgi:hypothetical protein